MIKEEFFDQFESYTNGSVSKEERISFDNRLSSDSEFAEQFEMYKAAVAVLDDNKPQVLNEKLDSIRSKYPTKKETRIRVLSPLAASIAACLVVFVISASYYHALTNYSTGGLIDREIDAYGSMASRNGSSTGSTADVAFKYYESANYQQAIEQFEQISEEDRNVKQQFYLANSYMLQNDFESAANILNEEKLIEDVRYAEVVDWYRALCDLKSGNEDIALNKLRSLSENANHSYSPKATELLEKLNSSWRSLPGVK